MHMNASLNRIIEDLILKGDINRGLLDKIGNSKENLSLSFSIGKSIFSIELEEGNDTHTYSLEELDFSVKDGKTTLSHPEKAFSLCLNWEAFENDTAVCNFHFKTNNTELTLRRIYFSLPDKAIFPENSGSDILMFPKASGMKIPEPAKEFFRRENIEYADWKDRTLFVWRDGFQTAEEIPDHYDYKSDTSMGWLDYYCDAGGIYMGAHDAAFDQTEAKVSVDKGLDGVGLCLIKTINRHISDYRTKFAISLHAGDWHRGADIYRKFYDSTGRTVRKLPAFMKKSPGVMCHYDFKWQDGSVNHRFDDIEAIYDEAVKQGYNQILIAGWNRAGFDNCYPDFTPAPELGTEQDMIDAVNKVKEKGGGVFFYINAFSFDMDAPDFVDYGAKWAAKKCDGSYYEEVYATSTLVGMCNSTEGWREKVKGNIKYLIQTIGANGVYVDQLNVVPLVCYDKTHRHEQSWKLNNNQILTELRKELGEEYKDKIFLFCEWATDGILPEIDSLLIQACWYYCLKYSTPEMFRYTFPEMGTLDMIMQKPWAATPESLEQMHVKDQFCKMFINGILFWTYDHVPYTPGFSNFFNNAIKMRNKAADYFAEGRFIDDINIEYHAKNITAKSFEMPNGDLFLCIWNKTGNPGEITLKTVFPKSNIKTLTLSGESSCPSTGEVKKLEYTESELSIIILEKN